MGESCWPGKWIKKTPKNGLFFRRKKSASPHFGRTWRTNHWHQVTLRVIRPLKKNTLKIGPQLHLILHNSSNSCSLIYHYCRCHLNLQAPIDVASSFEVQIDFATIAYVGGTGPNWREVLYAGIVNLVEKHWFLHQFYCNHKNVVPQSPVTSQPHNYPESWYIF